MKRFIFSACAILSGIMAMTAAQPNLNYTFTTGIDKAIRCETVGDNGADLDPKYYKATKPGYNDFGEMEEQRLLNKGWAYTTMLDPLDNTVKGCAYACTRLTGNPDAENLFILPATAIEKGDILAWRARSVWYDAPNSYKVMVATKANPVYPADYNLLQNITDESYFADWRTASLDAYAGQNLTLAFVTVKGGFMLAINEVHVGNPGLGYVARNVGRRFFGPDDDQVLATWELLNLGNRGAVNSLEAYNTADNICIATMAVEEGEISLGQRKTFVLPLHVASGSACEYILKIRTENAEYANMVTDEATDIVNHGTFMRKNLIEKFTGTWCNNCPSVYYPAHVALHRLGDEAIYVEPHSPASGAGIYDENGYNPYIMTLPTAVRGDFPALWYNREYEHASYAPTNFTPFNKALLAPCYAKVELEINSFDGQKIEATAHLTSATDLDNSNDDYRAAFTIVEKTVRLTEANNPQTNKNSGTSSKNYAEIIYAPTNIPNDITVLHNVVRAPAEGGMGIEKSLPATIEAGKKYSVPFSCEVPDNAIDPYNLQLIATMVHPTPNSKGVYTKVPVLNADAHDLTVTSSVNGINAEALLKASINGNTLALSGLGNNPVTVNITNLTGMHIAVATVSAENPTVALPNIPAGTVLIVTAKTADGPQALKVMK